MIRSAPARFALTLAFLAGIPALVYQVVWTREVGLLAGGQIGALSVVLVAFFSGLAIGNRLFGVVSDRSHSPLRLYGLLETAAGLSAAISIGTLRWLRLFPELTDFQLLAASAFIILPTTILLGGTVPALLRFVSPDSHSSPEHAGQLLGANTAGSVLGVALAVLAIPRLGLNQSLVGASLLAVMIGSVALVCARHRTTVEIPRVKNARARAPVLAAAFLVGAATLGFEVLATRLATLRLGSSLYAWGLVLSLFLFGLAAGNIAMARRARTTVTPESDLGWIEILAAGSVALGLFALRPDFASPSLMLAPENLIRVLTGVVPAAVAMGGAFPLLVRLSAQDGRISTTFGKVSAANTSGGIAGALLAPFVMLPSLGSMSTGLSFAAANAIVGLAFLLPSRSLGKYFAAFAFLLIACIPVLRTPEIAEDPWVLFVDEGRQATAVVTNSWGNRTLFVDGDPEASVVGNARRTEELLAVLPLILHAEPKRFLEIGLGSGITLGTATRFALERIDCVEIAASVVRAAVFFEPDNRSVARKGGPATIINSDARRLLARRPNTYDVISANTLHPWSIGATGLYSQEYFSRMSRSLRAGGIAVQWIPTQQIGRESVELILRTFFATFPEGGLWWGAGNIIALGSNDPLTPYDPALATSRVDRAGLTWDRLGWRSATSVRLHRIAGAHAVRTALGPGELLSDDRPQLEYLATRRRDPERASSVYSVLVEIAKRDIGSGAMLLWLESLEMRTTGDTEGAGSLEKLSADLGLEIAERARTSRRVTSAHRDLQAGRLTAAAVGFEEALESDADQRYALFGRAGLAIKRGDLEAAIRDLTRIVERRPNDTRAWNELAGVFSRQGDLDQARRAIEGALAANPYELRALANAGLLALESGDTDEATSLLARIRSISPLGSSPQEIFLRSSLAKTTANNTDAIVE